MKRKLNIKLIIYCLLILSIISTTISLILAKGNNWNTFLFGDETDGFMDFFNSLSISKDFRPYTYDSAIYPPLNYIIYSFLTLLIPQDTFITTNYLRNSFYGQNVFNIYNIITLLLLIITIYKYIEKCSKKNWFLVFLLIVSTPIIFAFQRGNIILLALIFLLFYLIYYDDKNKILREFALISLAISFNIKIYPAIFGILLLKDKRWKDAIKCSIYAIIIFICSLSLLGGIKYITNLINNMSFISNQFINQGFIGQINYQTTLLLITSSKYISNIIFIIIILLSCISIFFIKEKWKLSLLLVLLMIGIPSFSYEYVLIFMLIPLIEFISKKKITKKIDYVYGILMTLSIMSYAIFRYNPIVNTYHTLTVVIHSIVLLLLNLLIIYETIIIIVKKIAKKRLDNV